MAGSSNITGEESILFADNMSFDGTQRGGAMTTDGEIWIGSTTAPHVRKGTITGGPGVTITPGPGSIQIGLSGGGLAFDQINVDATSGGGTDPVVPSATGELILSGAVVAAGTNPIRTTSTAVNTISIEAQTSQALAAADATKIGLCNFNSANFSVTATGFVSIAGGGGMTWTEVTGTSQSAAVGNGYVANNAGLVTVTLPATCAIGDTVKVVGKGAGLFRITHPSTNNIFFVDTGYTNITALERYDSISVRCITANSQWVVEYSIGNFTVA